MFLSRERRRTVFGLSDTLRRVSDLAPTEEIYEFLCPENQRDLPHLVGK